jgi:uncharacterized Zn finger protein (UPF0148 family)
MNNDILKKGADYLLKGGTLLSEPCQTCNGLLIKFKGNVLCLNCQIPDKKELQLESENNNIYEQKEIEIDQKKLNKDITNKVYDFKTVEESTDLIQQIEATINRRIFESNRSIITESDMDKQQKNLKVLFLYLKILEKIKKLQ